VKKGVGVMPVFRLIDKPVFPSPRLASADGLLAVGGDLSQERLLCAYSMGIFPWYEEDQPILWWSPDPRLILVPDELRISRSLRKTINQEIFDVTYDTAFDEVIENCAKVHSSNAGSTWITEDMKRAYLRLHQSGFAHSVEVKYEGELAGGLYGVALGGAFFGESMFHLKTNASKIALVTLVQTLAASNFSLIDCQVTTQHLKSLGAREVPRSEFMAMLKKALELPTRRGRWTAKDE
jgi:leucyl/phenylalanyl-tRNA--protein transferase